MTPPQETVAMYAEHPIGAYALMSCPDMGLLSALAPLHRLGPCMAAAKKVRPRLGKGYMSLDQHGDGARLHACLPGSEFAKLNAALQELGLEPDVCPGPVSLVHLQGPHYGDRFGIVHAALAGLEAARIKPLAVMATLHSLYLVFAEADTGQALKGLSRNFRAPE